jgi:hypothetical protein
MAVCDVTEYEHIASSGRGYNIPVGMEPAITNQQIAVGGATAAIANPLNDRTRFIRVHSDLPVRIEVGGVSVEAATTSKRLAAGVDAYFGIPEPNQRPAGGMKVAVIQTT